MLAVFSDPRVARYLNRPVWDGIEIAHTRIARNLAAMSEGRYVCLGLERFKDPTLIGECTLFNMAAQCRRAEVGHTLAADAWGRGYMNRSSSRCSRSVSRSSGGEISDSGRYELLARDWSAGAVDRGSGPARPAINV